jgi:hypothetical protein
MPGKKEDLTLSKIMTQDKFTYPSLILFLNYLNYKEGPFFVIRQQGKSLVKCAINR